MPATAAWPGKVLFATIKDEISTELGHSEYTKPPKTGYQWPSWTAHGFAHAARGIPQGPPRHAQDCTATSQEWLSLDSRPSGKCSVSENGNGPRRGQDSGLVCSGSHEKF